MTDETDQKGARRNFPQHTLQQSLVIAQGLQDNNAGRPMKRILLAEAIGRKPLSSEFKYLLSSSFKYGLTIGTEKSETIELTELGKSIVKPISELEHMTALKKASLMPDLLKRIYAHYADNKLPSEQLLKNVLEREFNVAPERTTECYNLIVENGKLTGIIRNVSGSPYVVLDAPIEDKHDGVDIGDSTINDGHDMVRDTVPTPPNPITQSGPKYIFIAHGKNKTPLEQLKNILTKYKIPHIVATDEPHKGRPIGIKVADEMKKCSAGIFIFTADEETKNIDGETILRPNDNVVYELGAGTVLYGNKIVIMREDNVTFASNFTEFGHITFEKDKLNAKGLDIMSELAGLGIITFAVT
ncbi:MAG: nucleotide-binding protein [Candidatus Nitrosotalea sp.]|nr:nucleotide-binding protein [Candidatus Nitrosotalea sp.]